MARDSAERRAILHFIEEIRLLNVRDAAASDPKALIAEINAFDPTTLERFRFTMYPSDEDPYWYFPEAPRGQDGWLFQAALVDWWTGTYNPLHTLLEDWSPNFRFDPGQRVFMTLKARQLGVTWCAMALELWYVLYRPGAKCVAYSYNEDEAKKLVQRAWLMYSSLPLLLRNHVEVLAPKRGDEPSEWIKLRHKASGLISTIQALPATQKAGHGETVTFALQDEAARQDYCRNIFTSILPATARGNARLALVSTANGVGNPESEEGNFFHVLYATHRERDIGFSFLPWNAEPTRDERWYESYAMKLGEVDRNQMYPLNEQDAFMLSGSLFFDRDALAYYRHKIRRPAMRGQFTQDGIRFMKWMSLRDGIIDVWERPVPLRSYAMAVDAASGRGLDYTSMGVIDLESGAICAELHARIDSPRAALQAYALGKWFNTAKICVETQGGHGEGIITFLRDPSRGLPPYPNLYRHHDEVKGNRPIAASYGMPMGPKNRPMVVNGLYDWIRQRLFPWLSSGCVDELGTFVHTTTGRVSPAALPGCHDDRVMMLAMCAEMFRLYGRAPARRKRRRPRAYEPHPSRSV